MKTLKKIIHPVALILVPVTIFFLYIIWGFIASNNYDKQAEIKKELSLTNGDKTNEELNILFDKIKEKRKTIGKDGALSGDEILYSVTSIPFPQELYNKYQYLKIDHQNYNTEKTKHQEKGIPHYGRPSLLEYVTYSKHNILYNWLKSIFLGLLIGFILSLHPALQQGISWVFKLSLALSPALLLVFGMALLREGDNQNDLMEKIIDKSLFIYGTFIITYFVAHRNAYLTKPSQKIKNFYYDYGLGFIFKGIRICLYLFVPLSISLELLTQSPGIGTAIWESFENGQWDANTEIFLLSFLIVLYVFKIDFILLIMQYGINFISDKSVAKTPAY